MITSYHEEEKGALLLVLDWASTNCPTEHISVFSDSQALLKAIQGGAHDTQSIRQRPDNRKGPTILIYEPGQKVKSGNWVVD